MNRQKENFINNINETNRYNDNSEAKYMLIKYHKSIDCWEVHSKFSDYFDIMHQAIIMAIGHYIYDILVLTNNNTYKAIGIGEINGVYICTELIDIYMNIYLNSTYDTTQERMNIVLLMVCEAIKSDLQSLDDMLKYIDNVIDETNIAYIKDLNKISSMRCNGIVLTNIDSINNLYNIKIKCLRKLYDDINRANNIYKLANTSV